MNKTHNKNTRPLIIGSLLILAIFLITYLRFSFSPGPPDTAGHISVLAVQ